MLKHCEKDVAVLKKENNKFLKFRASYFILHAQMATAVRIFWHKFNNWEKDSQYNVYS